MNYFVTNFSQVGVPEPGKYRAVLSSDDSVFGGQQRVDGTVEHFTQPEGLPGTSPSDNRGRACLAIYDCHLARANLFGTA